ncbi:HET-domain-containing protein [Cenococcum geophilum 1.58]|uniref:HET-domain-containing protein n=1 Tax=Cenococcum geophilum 1.58 TaxID=794803 RepID=UPI00358F8C72|nr:HET-domain-containing protein [Cenococcum geophilum 1.58]
MADPVTYGVAIRNKTADTHNSRKYFVYSEPPNVTGGGVQKTRQILWSITDPLCNNSESVFKYTSDFYGFAGISSNASSKLDQETKVSIIDFEPVKIGTIKNDGTQLFVTPKDGGLQLKDAGSNADSGTFKIITDNKIPYPNSYVVGLARKCDGRIHSVAAVELKPGADLVFTPKQPIFISRVPFNAGYDVGRVLGSLGRNVRITSKGNHSRIEVEETGDGTFRVIEPYSYSPLTDGSWIRIIELFPGAESTELVCSLSERPLLGGGSYEALSWHWGEEERKSIIKIRRGDKISLFAVKPTLESALRHFRRLDTARFLWVDTVCINQDDFEEKSSQVRMMTEIYQEASSVCVWIGEEENDSGLAMDFIQLVQQCIERSDDLLLDGRYSRQWCALSALLRRPWFSRRWIIQEIALAKQAALHCGSSEVAWPEFIFTIGLVRGHVYRLSDIHGRVLPNDESRPWASIPTSGAARLVDVTEGLFEKSDHGTILKRFQSLENLVLNLTAFKASVPHDIIYAILPLAMDARSGYKSPQKAFSGAVETQNFPVNYSKTFFQVCQDFVRHTILKSGCIDIICQHWVPKEIEGLPSWIGNLSDAAFEIGPNREYYRINADSLVGLRGPGRRQYSAGFAVGSRMLSWEFGQGVCAKSLSVDGFILESIQKVQPSALKACIPLKWTRFVGWDGVSSPPPERFWRTLTANRDSSGNRAPSYYERLCGYAFQQSGKFGTDNVLDIGSLIDSGFSRVVKDYLQRVQSVVWNKRLITTDSPKSEGGLQLLGLAPAATQVGDLICILYGCSVPVVLRKIVNENSDADKYHYKLIGECYIHGMMNGEACELQKKSERERQLFEIQ